MAFSPIPELNLLKEFHDAQGHYFVQGFEMYGFGADNYQDSEPELAERLLYFAQANGSGSLYGIWRRDDREDLAAQPVVAMGDEGGIHLVARDLREFLRFLAACPPDAEPDIDWACFGWRDGYDPVDNTSYLAWLERTFGLRPADDCEDVVEEARRELGKEWAAFIHPYIPDAVWSPVHELNLLDAFRSTVFGVTDGFWLFREYGERRPEFGAGLASFGTNDSDTDFALWRLDDRSDPVGFPVVALGRSEGVHVVARDLLEFFRLIGAMESAEIWCDGDRVGVRPCEPGGKRDRYVAWLDDTFGLRPVDDPDAVLAAAQREFSGRIAELR